MKIRIKLTLLYYGITFTILLLLSFSAYFAVMNLLDKAFDKELDVLIDSIERSYNPATKNFDELEPVPSDVSPYLDYYLDVLNENQNSIYQSKIAKDLQLQIKLAPDSVKTGRTRTIHTDKQIPYLHTYLTGNIPFRVINKRIYYKGQPVGWVIAGMPIPRIEQSIQELTLVLISFLLIGILLTGMGGYYFIRKALSPINSITKRARQISSSNLSERLVVKYEEDELGQLTIVLNNLLERLEKAFKSQKEFLADAAHELKTPLSILRAHWEQELNNPDVSMELKEKMVHDVETITRLSHMINNLLLLSQTESMSSMFNFTEIRLDEILEEVITDASILAASKNHKLTLVEKSSVTLMGDRIRLYQLFFNIIDNAIKYIHVSGKIWVSLHTDNNNAIIKIIDNGPGIPPQDLPLIFNRFYRVQKDRSRRTGGSGLGLAICKLIAESHKGTITAESKIEEGTTIIVTLPLN